MQYVAALNTGEQAALDGWREQTTVFPDENVVDTGLSNLAAQIQKQDIVITSPDGGLEGFSVVGAVRGLVEEHGIPRIGALERNANTKRGLEIRQRFVRDLQGAVPLKEKADLAGFLASKCSSVGMEG